MTPYFLEGGIELPCGCVLKDGTYYMVDRSGKIDVKNLYSRPGKFIPVEVPDPYVPPDIDPDSPDEDEPEPEPEEA